MDAAQSIAEKAPPVALEETLNGLHQLLKNNSDASDALMKKYFIPFEVVEPRGSAKKAFLICDYNREGDSKHRLDDNLRSLEKSFMDCWESYKNLYYGHDSIGTVYLKPTDKGAFEGLFAIRKACSAGSWDSYSIVHADEPGKETCTYRVETYVRLILKPEAGDNTKTDISLTLSKEQTQTCKIAPEKIPINVSHIEHSGTIIEDNEMDLRSMMETVYIPKNGETLSEIQKVPVKKLGANPLMGIMMDSGMLKKRLAAQNNEDVTTTTTTESAGKGQSEDTKPKEKKRPMGIPQGVNPLMAGAMNSKILLKKKNAAPPS